MSSPAPSGTSTAELRTLLADTETELVALQAAMQQLAARRENLVRNLNSITYPILAIPPEITAAIFLEFASERVHIGKPVDPRLSIPRASCSPLILASVCRAWREIALSLQPLWTHLRILAPTSTSGIDSLLQCWLPRAGDHPLNLNLIGWEPAVNSLLSVLVAYSMQWRVFGCMVGAPNTFPCQQIRGRIPNLEKLYMRIDLGFEENQAAVTAVTGFEDAPRLREADLSGATLQWLSLPWTQLTRLTFSEQSTHQCMEILACTPNLEVLAVYLPLRNEALPKFVQLDHLHTLKFLPDSSSPDLLTHLTLPALHTLQLSTVDLPIDYPKFCAFHNRNQCSLRSVTLNNVHAEGALMYLKVMKTSTQVRLTNLDWLRHDFERVFMSLGADPTLLPALQVLTIDECGSTVQVPYSRLTDMLETRRSGENGTAILQSCKLSFGGTWRGAADELENMGRLRTLTAQGLGINIQALGNLVL